MVNTFFLDHNVYISAKCLDNKRLNQQVNEAHIIYKKIKDFRKLAQIYNSPIPTDDYQVYDWIRNIIKTYKADPNKDPSISVGYVYHPATLMWVNYFPALCHYLYVHQQECKSRGINANTTVEETNPNLDMKEYPPWTRDAEFIIRHRSNMVRKNADRYSAYFPGVNGDLLYFWPFTPKTGKNGVSDKDKRYQLTKK